MERNTHHSVNPIVISVVFVVEREMDCEDCVRKEPTHRLLHLPRHSHEDVHRIGRIDANVNEVWTVEIADWCRIGKQTNVGKTQEGRRVIVEGGEGRKIHCTLTESDETVQLGNVNEQGMVSVQKNTLSFVHLTFIVTSPSERIGSVLRVGEGGVVSLKRCEVSSSETIKHAFIRVSKDGEMNAEELKMSSMRFGGKGSVVSMSEEGRLALSSCEFDGVSFASGGVVVGKTKGKIEIGQTRFTGCSGTSLGSVIRVVTVGGEIVVTNCRFSECSTAVRLDEQGRRELGGGCVLVEMEQNGRSLSSCRVDLRESCFEGCTLRWNGKEQEGGRVVGGSGFLIVGRRGKGVVLLDGVRLSTCRCVGDGASALTLSSLRYSPQLARLGPLAICLSSPSHSARFSFRSMPILEPAVSHQQKSQTLPEAPLNQFIPSLTHIDDPLLHPPHSAPTTPVHSRQSLFQLHSAIVCQAPQTLPICQYKTQSCVLFVLSSRPGRMTRLPQQRHFS
ncbi:hypothetical protein BLNAU_5124 [Blattamonas nauphoetae]|uniref:Right handed beta helix domain-containing protein n=1 Tax=Blattamonas nauphoetae TaxID=2049346 RepID=A0ABQ9Y838_9EUKA|nr:hypothetical protein BLNAU_5124 [Blattamonas nauphoetae]